MAKFEIERKFLVKDESYKTMAEGYTDIAQGYLSRRPESTVRVRIRDGKAWLTIKGKTSGITREEYEYEVPREDAERMLLMCEGLTIRKRRWIVTFEGQRWEVDEFEEELSGLTLAEVELPSADAKVTLPPFIGQEVSDDPRYFNSNLSKGNVVELSALFEGGK